MSQHTSGPWEWTGIFIESDGVQIAQVVLSEEPEGLANARLIAAAPELLACLTDILDLAESEAETLHELGRDDADTALAAEDATTRIETARVAIAKAMGAP